MKIYTPIGSKERLVEMFQRVNRVKLSEGLGQSYNPQNVLEMAFEGLKNGNLDVLHSNSQANGDQSFIELVCKDKQGNNITFVFKTNSTAGDQEGVYSVNNVSMTSFSFDDPTGEDTVEMDEPALRQFNAQHTNDLFDAIQEYIDVEDEEPVDSLYEDAITMIDASFPFGGNPEKMQTSQAYGDEKPTNDAVRVKSPELQKFAPEKVEEEVIGEPKPPFPVSTKSPVDDLPPAKKQIILKAFDNLTYKRGRREYAPSAAEINGEIQRMMTAGEVGDYNSVQEEYGEEEVMGQELKRFGQEVEPQNLDAVEVDDQPVPEVGEAEKEKIFTAYDSLVQKGIPMPTTMQIMDELDRMAGKVKQPTKNRLFPKEAEPFLEGESSDFVQNAAQQGLAAIIKRAAMNVDQRLGDEKFNMPHEQFIKLVEVEANKILAERRLATMNEEEDKEKKEREKGEYPDQLGKKFKPKLHYPKKKKKPQTVVKISEGDQIEVPEENVEIQTGDENPELSQLEKDNPDVYPEGWKEMDGMFMGPNSPGYGQNDKTVSVPQGEMNGENDGMSLEPQGDEIEQLSQEKEMGGEELQGGVGDGKSPMEFDPDQVSKGIKVEMEHSSDPKIAIEIVLDHLTEDPQYYGTGDEDPEASAQAGAVKDAEGSEGSEDKEMTDILLGFKPHNVGDEVEAGEETEEVPEETPEEQPEPEEAPEEEEEETEEDKERSNAINEELVKIAKKTLSKREVPTGMTKKEAVQILIKNNTRTLL